MGKDVIPELPPAEESALVTYKANKTHQDFIKDFLLKDVKN